MTLTAAQAAGIMAMLAGKIDPATLQTIDQILNLHIENPGIPEGDSYTNIRQYSENLYQHLKTAGKGIITEHPEDEMLMVHMDREKVRRLFGSVPADGYLAALPGLHEDSEGRQQFTVSLLAMDGNKMPLTGHIAGTIHGEQCWDSRNIMKNFAVALPTDHLV